MTRIEQSVKVQKLKRALANGTNRTEALISIGYAQSTAIYNGKKIVDRLLKKEIEKIESKELTLSQHLAKRGYDDKSIADVLADGLGANKVISAVIVGKDADERTNDFIEIPDHSVRGQFVDRVAKIRGYYPDPKLKIEHSGNITHRYESIIALITDTDSDEDVIDIEIGEEDSQSNQEVGCSLPYLILCLFCL